MDTKLTLSFDQDIIIKAKELAARHNISLSRLIEFLLSKAISGGYSNIEELPISDWVLKVAEGDIEYKTRKTNRKAMRDQFLSSKK